MKTYDYEDLNRLYESMTMQANIEAVTTTRIVGGLPASEEGLRAFVKYQMKLTIEDDVNEALRSIVTHELNRPLGSKQTLEINTVTGERTIKPEEPNKFEPEQQQVLELAELQTNSVNMIRRDEHGPYLGDWMIKANIKAAASRIGLFVAAKGVKGDMNELGRVRAAGSSALDLPDRYNLNRLYLRDADGKPIETYMDYLRGRISTPQGAMSIITLAEMCPPGAHVSFQFRFFDNAKVKEDDVARLFSASQNIGWGSAKAFECGKFKITKLTVERASDGKKAPSKKIVDVLPAQAVNEGVVSAAAAL